MSKALPKEITSYDLLKALAIVLMLIDHMGYYFFTDDLWWRVVGRMCVPIWFFLIGYANSRNMEAKLWIGAIILVLVNIPTGNPIFPLNILATMLAIRLVLNPYMERALRNDNAFWAMAVILFALSLPTNFITEYGTMGLVLAMYGYLYRHRENLKLAGKTALFQTYMIVAPVGFLVTQHIGFGFSETQLTVVTMGIFGVISALFFFKPATYPELTKKLPTPAVWLIQIMGRRTLEIYVLHLILFKVLAPIYNPEIFTYFEWTWLPENRP